MSEAILAPPPSTRSARLKAIASAQLRVGSLGFGGPLATMAMMREELIRKRGLGDDERYLEALAFVKLLPGPTSSLLAMYLGMEVAGVMGGLLSVICFILPSFLMLLAVALFETSFVKFAGGYLWLADGFHGLQIAVLAVISFTCVKLFREALGRSYFGQPRTFAVILFAALSGFLAYQRIPELQILLAMALAGVFYFYFLRSGPKTLRIHPFSIFWTFFTAGFSVFGTAYMILPHLERVLVTEKAWLTSEHFMNAVTFGNLTPGPVMIASTYMGYQMAGLSGSLLATLGIFLGPIILMIVVKPFSQKIFAQRWIEGAWVGILPAVASTIAVSVYYLGEKFAWGSLSFVIFALTFVLLQKNISVLKIFLGVFILSAIIKSF